MEEPADLIKKFKSKVEEAILLLPDIPESQRLEIWAYWQVLSVAVKAAVGGRGSYIAKETKSAIGKRRRGRPRKESKDLSLLSKQIKTVPRGIASASSTASSETDSTLIKGAHWDEEAASETEELQPADSKRPRGRPRKYSTRDKVVISDSKDAAAGTTKRPRGRPRKEVTADIGLSSDQTKIVPQTNTDGSGVLHAEDNRTTANAHNAFYSEGDDTAENKRTCVKGEAASERTCTSYSESKEAGSVLEEHKSSSQLFLEDGDSATSVVSRAENEANGINVTNSNTDETTIGTPGDKPNLTDTVISHLPPGTEPILSEPLPTLEGERLNSDKISNASEAKLSTAVSQRAPSGNRKPGRPRKHPVRPAAASPPGAVVSKSSTEQQSAGAGSVPVASNLGGSELSVAGEGPCIDVPSMAALGLKEKGGEEGGLSASKVRRSDRRAAPKKDKEFYYFDRPLQIAINEDENSEAQEEKTGKEIDEASSSKLSSSLESLTTDAKDVTSNTRGDRIEDRTCKVCNHVVGSASSMPIHMRIHTGERPFACPMCHKTFTTKGNCERHETTHVGLKAFACPQCNRKFTVKKSLKVHMRTHTGERPYKCPYCERRFFQKGTMTSHMDRHTGRKSLLCELCGKTFRQGSQLRVHMRRHNNDMTISCQHCEKKFYTKCEKERHMTVHTGERPFACQLCPKTFTRQQYLHEHMDSHRVTRRPYKCAVCGLAFRDFPACHRHVNKHKLPEDQQASQQIHVEVASDVPTEEVLSHITAILKQQNQGTEIQALVIPEDATGGLSHILDSAGVTATEISDAATISAVVSDAANPSDKPIAAAAAIESESSTILRKLMVNGGEMTEVCHLTVVDPGAAEGNPQHRGVVGRGESAEDFSAINMLANATAQQLGYL